MAGQLKGSRAELFFPPDVRVIFSIALLLRLAFFFHQQSLGSPFHYDGKLYLALADGLEHGVFSMFHPLEIPETTGLHTVGMTP